VSEWEEIETQDFLLALAPDMRTFRRRAYEGTVTVMAGTEQDGYHLSISHPRRYPTWDEICDARDRFTPLDTTMVMLMPPRERWVNVHNNCFHLWAQLPCEHNGGALGDEDA
jgi:hypothetical protein